MPLGFIFPGQGSQSLGMLAPLAQAHPVVQRTFATASDVLGFDLWQLVQNGPEEKLNETQNTQPALLCASVAIWRVWNEKQGPKPVIMAGHSLGEYSALVCSGSVRFEDAVMLVAKRGEYMQEAVPAAEGAMAAILGLSDEQVKAACNDAAQGEVVNAVNFNSPGQVVIAGNAAAVDRAIALCKEAGAKRAVKLAVSAPSHCPLMESAAELLMKLLQSIEIHPPVIPVLNNVDVTSETAPDKIRDALKRQLCNPVRWVETIQKMHGQGIDRVIECGPGKVLVGLNKRIEKSMIALPIFSPETIEEALV
ncbi:MAG: ACP S-malonyltransferase [Gammaproteobacteria bacterium]|nr:ACP S-malonyltransferase [Gammaproteobacteria bacterium]